MRIILHIEDAGDSIGLSFACRVAEQVREEIRGDLSFLPDSGVVYAPVGPLEDSSMAAIAHPTKTGFSVRIVRSGR